MKKTVLVMGASRGLGRSVAEAFVRRGGWDVVGMARTACEVPGVRMVQADICDEAAVTRLIHSLERLDVLVVNAAIAKYRPSALDAPTEDLRVQFETNVVGPFIAMREACRRMVAAREGLIINVGSTFSLEGYGPMAPYCATKHALLGLSRSFRQEMRKKGVRICTYCPGDMNTGILGDATRNPKRMNTDDIAPTLVHIAELPSYVEVGEIVVNPLPR
jgi:NAD(P)-dependent dehydrogenase (short-subunit alcohol dehydrogenase family)